MKMLTFAVVTAALGAVAFGTRQHTALDTIRLPEAVVADGKVIVAGTYEVRLTNDVVARARGEGEDSERWVAFVAHGEIVGREMASVVPDADIDAIVDGPRPKPNTSRVEILKGHDYLRVWINRDGVNYLIHLPLAQ